MVSNSDNPKNGTTFQKQVKDWFDKEYNQTFELEQKIAIGNPPKDHKFDIVCEEERIVIECKRYTWTETGNIPSAKMAFTNEAAFYLSFLSEKYTKYIVMLCSHHQKRNESLAEYYYRTYKHLIGDIHILEYDPENDVMKEISEVNGRMNENHINDYHEYIRLLKETFGDIKIMPMDVEIYAFIQDYNLESDWNVVIDDVKQDITQSVLLKNKRIIRSYNEYLEKLKEWFGIPTSIPTEKEIQSFIDFYNLEMVYGITILDVEEDLKGFINGNYDDMYEKLLQLKQKAVYKPVSRTLSQYTPRQSHSYNKSSIQIQKPTKKPTKKTKSKPKPETEFKLSKKNKSKVQNKKQENVPGETFLIDGDNHINEGVKGIEQTTKNTKVKGYFSIPGAKRKFDKKYGKRPNVSSELVEPGNQAVDKRIIKDAEKITQKENQKVTIVSQDKGFKKVQRRKKNGSSISIARSVREKLKKNRNRKRKGT